MFATLKTLTLSAMIGLGSIAALPAAAQADSLSLTFGDNNGFGIQVRDRDRDWRDRDRRGRHHREVRSCSPDRALNKAERIGLRRVAIRNVTRNTISVSGRDRGDRVVVTFGRGRNCPILRY
jgi:hypothetical protein